MMAIGSALEHRMRCQFLRVDPMFKLALDRLPSDEELCLVTGGDHQHPEADDLGQAMQGIRVVDMQRRTGEHHTVEIRQRNDTSSSRHRLC